MNRSVSAVVVMIFISAMAFAQEQPTPPKGGDEQGRMMQRKEGRMMPGGGDRMPHGGDKGMHGGPGRDCMLEGMLENSELMKEIGVSEESVKEIKAKIVDISRQQVELEAKQKLAAMDQAELMKAETLDEKALMKAVEKSGAIHTEIAKLRISKMILMKKSLTPEQIKKAREVFGKKMRERFAEGGGPMIQPGQEGQQRPFMRERLKQKNKSGSETGRPRKSKDDDEDDDDDDDDDKTQPPPPPRG